MNAVNAELNYASTSVILRETQVSSNMRLAQGQRLGRIREEKSVVELLEKSRSSRV